MKIKPIETIYNGYRFRSRLEARWAVFFDTLDIKYEYEKEGFDLGNGIYYLPDFVLHEYANDCEINNFNDITLEIKGEMPSDDEKNKMVRYAMYNSSFYIAIGMPYKNEYDLYQFVYRGSYGDSYNTDRFISTNYKFEKTNNRFMTCPLCKTTTINSPSHNCPGKHVYMHIINGDIHFKNYEIGIACMYCDCINRDRKETDKTYFYKGNVFTSDLYELFNSEKLLNAYRASKSARFEFDR